MNNSAVITDKTDATDTMHRYTTWLYRDGIAMR